MKWKLSNFFSFLNWYLSNSLHVDPCTPRSSTKVWCYLLIITHLFWFPWFEQVLDVSHFYSNILFYLQPHIFCLERIWTGFCEMHEFEEVQKSNWLPLHSKHMLPMIGKCTLIHPYCKLNTVRLKRWKNNNQLLETAKQWIIHIFGAWKMVWTMKWKVGWKITWNLGLEGDLVLSWSGWVAWKVVWKVV